MLHKSHQELMKVIKDFGCFLGYQWKENKEKTITSEVGKMCDNKCSSEIIKTLFDRVQQRRISKQLQ